MKIKNITDSIQREEIRSARFSMCCYDSVEKLESFRLSELLTESEYQYVIKEKNTEAKIRNRFEKTLKEQKRVLSDYVESAKNATVQLCYFPIYYMRLDGFKYTVGFESACRSRERSFGIHGKKDHFVDLFSNESYNNKRFFDLNNNEGDDARKSKYANITVLSNNNMNKVITMNEFDNANSGDVYASEYQVLQTVYYPIWKISFMFDGEERVSYLSDSEDFANLTVAYNQNELEEISHNIKQVRKFFWRLGNAMFWLWSWIPIVFLSFVTSIIVNVENILNGYALDISRGMALGIVISVLVHWLIYYVTCKAIDVHGEQNILVDSIKIGEKKATFFKYLFVLSISVLPIVLTAVLEILD